MTPNELEEIKNFIRDENVKNRVYLQGLIQMIGGFIIMCSVKQGSTGWILGAGCTFTGFIFFVYTGASLIIGTYFGNKAVQQSLPPSDGYRTRDHEGPGNSRAYREWMRNEGNDVGGL